MMRRKKILFGFYKGLGDFISDSHLIEIFLRYDFQVSIAVSSWFSDLAKFMLPTAHIISYKSSKELIKIDYDYDYIFLTPNYLHPFTLEKRAFWLYLSKYLITKAKSEAIIIRPSFKELVYHYLQIKKTFLDEHFYIMSLTLLRKFFPELKFRSLLWNSSFKPKVDRILVFPFSGHPGKDYPLKKLSSLLETLKDKNIDDIQIFVTKKDLKAVEHLKKQFKVRSLSLIELAKVFKTTDLVISGDTGPAHLAAYYGANLVVLYGYTKAEKYKPIGSGKIITIESKTGVLKDVKEEEILEKIYKNFSFMGRSNHGEPNVINLHSNVQ